MAKNLIFRGAATALITPINADGVDFKKLRELVDWQMHYPNHSFNIQNNIYLQGYLKLFTMELKQENYNSKHYNHNEDHL